MGLFNRLDPTALASYNATRPVEEEETMATEHTCGEHERGNYAVPRHPDVVAAGLSATTTEEDRREMGGAEDGDTRPKLEEAKKWLSEEDTAELVKWIRKVRPVFPD